MEIPVLLPDEPDALPLMATESSFQGEKSRDPAGTLGQLDFHASGFLARVEGVWTQEDLAQFRNFLNNRQLAPTDEELHGCLQRASQEYLQGRNRLYLCAARPCCQARDFDVSDTAMVTASRTAGLPISTTGCQGQCKHAPVMSLRIGNRKQMLAHVERENDWQAVLNFADAAVRSDSLLISPGEAGGFLHDPVHEHDQPDPRLKTLRFLLGHFQGEGCHAASGYTFQKEVIGAFEAGGRFIALRMAASYPLADGRQDTHRALVIVGPARSTGGIIGRAYTDSGGVHEYEVEQAELSLQFADAPPDHGRHWKRARKLLRPTDEGFEERLEVDAGEGFIPYYTIRMHKRAAL
ncbi:MAG TPA: hypothetical protein VHH73_17050 [Verrucomicrobiae bacterium]|nr:hypothetical protein [Verrucomicrobiae bacterium]